MCALFELVPNIFSVGTDLAGLPRLCEPTIILVEAAAHQLKLDPTGLRQPIERFYELIQLRGVGCQVRAAEWPFLFHRQAWSDAQQLHREHVYCALAPSFHILLRRFEESLYNSTSPFTSTAIRSILYRRGVAICYALRSIDDSDVASMSYMSTDHAMDVIERAFEAVTPGRHCRRAGERTLTIHRGRCKSLIKTLRRLTPRRPIQEPRRWQPLTSTPGATSYLQRDAGSETVFTIRMTEEASEAGEAPGDYAEAVEVSSPRRRSWAAASTSRDPRVITPWEPDDLHPSELAALYAGVIPLRPEEMTPTDQAMALGALIPLHHGLDPSDDRGVRVAADCTLDERGWGIDPVHSIISHVLPAGLLGYRNKFPLDPDRHLPGGPVVPVPLVPLLARLVTSYWSWRRSHPLSMPFLLVERSPSVRPLRIADLEARLQSVAHGVTLARLRRTCEALYIQAGLEPVLVNLIAGRFQFTTLSTIFYTNVPREALAAAHHQAYLQIQAWILQGCPGTPPPWLLEEEGTP